MNTLQIMRNPAGCNGIGRPPGASTANAYNRTQKPLSNRSIFQSTRLDISCVWCLPTPNIYPVYGLIMGWLRWIRFQPRLRWLWLANRSVDLRKWKLFISSLFVRQSKQMHRMWLAQSHSSRKSRDHALCTRLGLETSNTIIRTFKRI